ncbi:YT521-B-like domain-containing protein [Gamsiella multidivaricata]|uniref:YT521-B-like domain-containing protein n=1 Tax=Gamsiella multidivaricata TaxID=101098 RepID=UPI002220534F|nr:YT521-B-like domain-containing protein [Gamsiella multidivaricata]KAI7826153.1 YT521-B-like domain-containing protein [Gamsiella multidivaricata]
MLDHISTENERAITTGRENEIWQPATEDLPLSPEMKAAMLAEIEQAAKEGRQITNEEAAVIARNSTTTKSWGIRFPIQWMHVHKVPFSKTTHMLNPLYENREIKVSKDGTEVDPAIGERLLELFKKPNCSNRRGRSSVSGQGSRSDSDGSRRSSVAEELSSLAPPQSHRSASSRRSSIMSTRSAGSGGGDRRTSIDPSRAPGSSYKNTHSSMHMTNRGHFSGDVNQPYSGAGGYRGSPRHGHFGSHSSHGSNTSQGPFAADQYPDQQRSGWGNKPNYRGGGPGGYGTSSMSGAGMQGGFYQQDHSPNHRKGGSGGPGGKYGSSYHPSSQHGGYENPPFHLPHAPRRHTGLQHHSYPGSYRPNMSSPAADPSLGGNSGYKHDVGGAPPGSGGPAGQQDQSYSGRSRGGPIPPGAHIPPNQLGGQPILTHPGVYNGQGPPVGYPAPFPPPGYPMMPPYMGYPYVPGPNPFIHGTIAWHPGQGPPMPAGMISGAGMVTGHPTSMPMIPGAGGEGGHGMEGMVPLFGYDGVAYGYVPAEEAYHQSMTGYGYMSHDPHASEQADVEAHINSDEELTGTGSKGNDQGADDAGVTTENVEEGSESHDQRGRQAQSQSFTDSAKHDTEDRQQDYASTSAASDQATSGAGDDVVGKEER